MPQMPLCCRQMLPGAGRLSCRFWSRPRAVRTCACDRQARQHPCRLPRVRGRPMNIQLQRGEVNYYPSEYIEAVRA